MVVFAVMPIRPSAASTRSVANRGLVESFVKGDHAVDTRRSGAIWADTAIDATAIAATPRATLRMPRWPGGFGDIAFSAALPAVHDLPDVGPEFLELVGEAVPHRLHAPALERGNRRALFLRVVQVADARDDERAADFGDVELRVARS